MSVDRRREAVEPVHPELSVVRQCELVLIARSTFYREPAPETPLNLALMRRTDEQFLETPWYGSRQMMWHFRREGHGVGRKRVRRLMRKMGLVPIYQRPRTTMANPEHRIYPYLLRDLAIDRPNQVWCTDITYIPMRRGFLYLVAVMDWASRNDESWGRWHVRGKLARRWRDERAFRWRQRSGCSRSGRKASKYRCRLPVIQICHS